MPQSKLFNTLAVCTASSLVGEMIKAEGESVLDLFGGMLLPIVNSLFSSGRPNIRVFPLPVALEAMMSCRSNKRGNECAWIGVGAVMFIFGDFNVSVMRLSRMELAKSFIGSVP